MVAIATLAALIPLRFLLDGAAVTLAAVAASCLVLFLFFLSWIGPADAKFLVLALLALRFHSPLEPFIFVVGSLLLWVAVPTREGLRLMDGKILLALLVLALIEIRVGVMLLFFYLGYLKYLEVKYLPSSCRPFLHVLLAAVLLQVALH